jgi:threonine dehydrogenase-like Zn-dependent dehydrogenase
MRAVAVLPGTRESAHVRDDVPEPTTSEFLAQVRVLETGICGTDVEIHEGLYGQAPPGSPYLVLGHENLGVVETAPSGSGLAPGQLVVSTVRRPCADRCRPCLSERNDMCATGNFEERGIRGRHGFMAERYTEAPRYLVPVSTRLRPVAVLLEPLTIVEKGLELALDARAGLPWEPRRATVLGAGAVGILAAMALRLRGLDVTVVSLEPEGGEKDHLLQEAGIAYVSSKTTPLEALASRIGYADLVFEATGATAVVWPAMRLLARNGVCVLTSVTAGEKLLELDLATWNRDIVLGNRLVLGTVNAARRHFEAGVSDLEAAEQRLPGWVGRLITRRVPLTDVKQALHHSTNDIKTVLTLA